MVVYFTRLTQIYGINYEAVSVRSCVLKVVSTLAVTSPFSHGTVTAMHLNRTEASAYS
jgi:hypothetical protein